MSPPPRSIAVLAAVQAVRLTLGVAVAILAARWLGPEGWGLLGFARGAAQAWWFLIGLGALDLVTRAVAHDPRAGAGLVAGLHRALPAAAVLGTLGTALTAWAIDGRADVVGLAALAALVAAVTARGVVDESALLATGHARDQLAPTIVARLVQAVGL